MGIHIGHPLSQKRHPQQQLRDRKQTDSEAGPGIPIFDRDTLQRQVSDQSDKVVPKVEDRDAVIK
jgi:hypothetical protein